ncbi:N-dimethylarginine dimethylaminohydrolase [Dysgonomonas sp. PFB1-18]|uniref:dimethylarginine dimethylaminohydrolase family protein n=1 Tax=unclassified Dysgonomonas TaxID=2630389 RepID=UPI0024762BC7|nr:MULTISPECIES: arginine deiminase-related protein [unclassified Dysgonomonas]MDH6307658.1 N-dimethylarginine dimethylaminohydrolase [Dysgonomonas sp. PF1-14]MDH6337576.1 N-dimethylarginine dimethylaminohydrolase [Dysgonomonas sp. PF1-16]MDH6378800.1 N-dimethylarginine dimethylaminohydrolase [Dysgonomonas sp. PFB1-18]MDH6396435.1 N-dimethylarginine dimethylaminohydrolase [Dysgonomonas sp. PF1-23]
MILNIQNETSQLKTVVLGQPYSLGKAPSLEETYDAKSYESVQKGMYPVEEDIATEMTAFEKVFLKYGVEVLRPLILPNCNQVYARDVAFVIDDKIITSNIIPDRADEQEAYAPIYSEIAFNKIYNLPEKAHVEGGDVVLYNDTIFVGTYTERDYPEYKTARTNAYAIAFLRELFSEKTFIPLELEKDDTDPRKGILHLDCTFMPVGNDKAIIYKGGFKDINDYQFLVDFFGKENVFDITREEMYYMNTNVFSISPTVVVSEERFTRLNQYMRDQWELTVEVVPYYEISKMGGLLRCSTLPLVRE